MMRNCQSRRLQRRISDGKCFHGIRAYQNLSGFCFGSCLVQRSLQLHCRTDWRKRCRKKHNHQCRFRIDPLCCPCVLWYGYNASLVVIVWLYRDKRYPAGRRRQPAVRISVWPGKIADCLYDVIYGVNRDYYGTSTSYQFGFSCKGEYPSGFPYCTYHFCYLVFCLVPDCGKGISETGH